MDLFESLKISTTLNVVFILTTAYFLIKSQKLKGALEEVASDMVYDVAGSVATVFKTTVMINKNKKGVWEAARNGLTAKGTTPIHAAINLVNLIATKSENQSQKEVLNRP